MPESSSELPGGRDFLRSTLTARLAHAATESVLVRFAVAGYYVQWGPAPGALQVEIVSDAFLDEPLRIGEFGAGRMRRLGFIPPSQSAPNWTMLVQDPGAAFHVSDRVIEALLEVYRVPIAELVLAVGRVPGPDIPPARPIAPVRTEGTSTNEAASPSQAAVPPDPEIQAETPTARTADQLRELCRILVDQVGSQWDESHDERGRPYLKIAGPSGIGLPWTATVDSAGVLEVVTELGEFLLSRHADLTLAMHSSALVALEPAGTPAPADPDGRVRSRVVARSRIDLEASTREVPLATVVDLGRRQSVSLLLYLLDLEDEPDEPRWLGAAAVPDALALATLLTLQLPPNLRPDVRAVLRQAFDDARLGHPWVPAVSAEHLAADGDWSWSTASSETASIPPGMDAYMFTPVLQAVMADWTPRFHLSHAGHGLNSYGLNYVWVGSRVSVVAQTAFGGVYMDPVRTTARALLLAADLSLIERLSHAVANWPGEQARLVLWASDFRGIRGWSWPAAPVHEFAPDGSESARMERWGDMLGTGVGPAVAMLEEVLAEELGFDPVWVSGDTDIDPSDYEDPR